MLRVIVKNTRIIDGRSFIGMGLLGMVISFKNNPEVFEALLLAISLILYVGYAFAINNCFDIDTDLLNPRKKHKNPVASGELSFKGALLTSLAIILLGGILAYFISKSAFVTYITMSFLATIYSAPPRLKSIPIADVLSHGLFFGALPFIYGSYFDGMLSETEIFIALSLFIYSVAMELRNHLEDYESDQKANLKTTPIIIGKSTSEALINILSLLSLALLLNSLYSPFGIVGILGVATWNRKVSYRIWDSAMVLFLLVHALKAIIGV